MAKRTDAETMSRYIRNELRRLIVVGEWAPGERLQLAGLSERFKTSSTVIREALTRLAGERLVVLRPNRGFFIPTLSQDELRDITHLRCVNEEFAVGLAIERGDLTWESDLIAAHHTMERTPTRDDNNQLTSEWAVVHQKFHNQLLAACGVPVLLDLCSTLSDLTQLYNRWAVSATNWSGRDLSVEHRQILDAALDRDAELTGQLLTQHYKSTLDAITKLDVEAGLPVEAVSSEK